MSKDRGQQAMPGNLASFHSDVGRLTNLHPYLGRSSRHPKAAVQNNGYYTLHISEARSALADGTFSERPKSQGRDPPAVSLTCRNLPEPLWLVLRYPIRCVQIVRGNKFSAETMFW